MSKKASGNFFFPSRWQLVVLVLIFIALIVGLMNQRAQVYLCVNMHLCSQPSSPALPPKGVCVPGGICIQ